MKPEVTIRLANEADAPNISEVIREALQVSNAIDYPASVIQRLVRDASPDNIRRFITDRIFYVAQGARGVIGTASLDKEVVRTVFIAPQMQNQGIGRQLMSKIEEAAVQVGQSELLVPSSITAVQFYEKLGFHHLREEVHDAEKTIYLTRNLSA